MSVGIRLAASVAGVGLLLHAVKRAAIAKAVIVCFIISVCSGFVINVLLVANKWRGSDFQQFVSVTAIDFAISTLKQIKSVIMQFNNYYELNLLK